MRSVGDRFAGLREYARAMKCAPIDVKAEARRLAEDHARAAWDRLRAKWASKHKPHED